MLALLVGHLPHMQAGEVAVASTIMRLGAAPTQPTNRMTIRNLDFLLKPKSIAVVGASEVPGSYGAVALRNLIDGGFGGPILPVALRERSLFGIGTHPRIQALPMAADLALVCSAPENVAAIIAELGARGTKAAIVGIPGLPAEQSDAMLRAARPHLMRILGPGSGGVMVPPLKLNASFAHLTPAAGRIAFVAQSAAVAGAVLDWAKSKGIGFSCVVHLGDSADVDLADVLDYLATDPQTASILMHFETVASGRKFMSAARAAARNKPVVAIKGGWIEGAAERAGAPARPSSGAVYSAALRRAGIVRVPTIEALFDAAEALARARPIGGERLSILANGAGLGRIAADVLVRAGGRIAGLSAKTRSRLAKTLAPGAPQQNPVALKADASPGDFAAALSALLEDGESDAVLVINAPSAFAPSAAVAAALCRVAEAAPRNVFTCWLGGEAMSEARRVAAAHGVPSYDSPEDAVGVFLGIVNYRRNRDLLMQMPPSIATDFSPDTQAARAVIDRAVRAGRERLSESEACALLDAYGIAVAAPARALTGAQAAEAAQQLGFPVDLSVLLAQPDGKASVAASAYALESGPQVRSAARNLRRRMRERHPDARIEGFSLRHAALPAGARELSIGVGTDPVFGPVILFGQGGSSAAVARDSALALPPLNLLLAHDLISRTRVGRLLADHGAGRALDREAVCLALERVSQIITDLDEIVALDIDPLVVDDKGANARAARIYIAAHKRRGGSRRFAIRPYPKELEQRLDWGGAALLIRPIRPEDETMHRDFIAALEPEDARNRFFSTMRELPRSQLARFTQIDYDREMALVAVETAADGTEHELGVVRAVTDPDNVRAEFAVVVGSGVKGKGLGKLLMERIIEYCRARGTQELIGETLADNQRMQKLAQACGFSLSVVPGEGTVALHLRLR